MQPEINLKELERRAWRSVFQDGLWDIYLGLLLMAMAILTLLVVVSHLFLKTFQSFSISSFRLSSYRMVSLADAPSGAEPSKMICASKDL